jgi:hypothetical protein
VNASLLTSLQCAVTLDELGSDSNQVYPDENSINIDLQDVRLVLSCSFRHTHQNFPALISLTQLLPLSFSRVQSFEAGDMSKLSQEQTSPYALNPHVRSHPTIL